MTKHLSQEELIKYQFELASEEQVRTAAGHLEECGACRERLAELKEKFTGLELLRPEVTASDELIEQTLAQIRRQGTAGAIQLRKSHWIAAAVAIVACGLFAVEWLGRAPREKEPAGSDVEIVRVRESVAKPEQLDREMASLDSDAAAGRPIESEVSGGYIVGENIVAAEAVAEKPPFAPASNIELVTLPRREKVQLTIYNSADLTLVRERRNLTMKAGWNWLQFMWANTLIDPTSLGLEPVKFADRIEVEQLVFPPRLREVGRWLIKSQISGQAPFEITYFTSGLQWRAFYMGTLSSDEKSMTLAGYVRVTNNSGEEYEEAETRLIVGEVNLLDEIAELARREHPYDRPGIWKHDHSNERKGWSNQLSPAPEYGHMVKNVFLGVLEDKEIIKEGLSEYFLYTIEGTETIPNGWGKRLPSFVVQDVPVESLYKYDEDRWGDQTVRFVSFVNDAEHKLGETPIPDGKVKIYRQTGQDKGLSYVGGTEIKYVPVNEEVELQLVAAREVKVEPKLMDFRTENYVFDRKGNVAGWDEIRSWRVTVANTRELPVKLEITRGFGTAYWSLTQREGKAAYQKHDALRGRFTLVVEPRSKEVFEYEVRSYHGQREGKSDGKVNSEETGFEGHDHE